MSKTPYENLHDVWNGVVDSISESDTPPDDLEEILSFPNLETILLNIRSIYTGVESENGIHKYSPIFFSDSGLLMNTWIVLSGTYATDAERMNNFLAASADIPDSVANPSDYKVNYVYMGYMDKTLNPTGDPYLGGFRNDPIDSVDMLTAMSWFTGHWQINKPALVQLVSQEVYNVIKRVFEIIDEYTNEAHCFSGYIESCNQYFCTNRYDALSDGSREYYSFDDIDNYNFSEEEEGRYGTNNEYNPTFHVYALQKFPIGYVYISSSSKNPEDIFGYGTWEPFAEGRMLVGVNPDDSDFDEALKTGGEKTHTLTTTEIPTHTHNYTRYVTNNGYPTNANVTGGTLYYWKGNTQNNATTQPTGGGNAHNNMPPYITVYMFRRVS